MRSSQLTRVGMSRSRSALKRLKEELTKDFFSSREETCASAPLSDRSNCRPHVAHSTPTPSPKPGRSTRGFAVPPFKQDPGVTQAAVVTEEVALQMREALGFAHSIEADMETAGSQTCAVGPWEIGSVVATGCLKC